MTNTVAFPSPHFPAFPGVSLQVPDGWQPIIVPGVMIAVALPPVEGTFRQNLVVAISRFAAGYELQTAIDAVTTKFASLEGSEEIGRDLTTLNGHEWFHIESTFLDPRAGTLVQAAQLAIVEQGGFVDLIQITGTVSAAQAQEFLPQLRDIQRSVVLSA